jgi:hypothetical protein
MPSNARTWLAMRSGNTENPTQGAYDLMLTLMLAHNKHTYDFSADLQEKLELDSQGNIARAAGEDKSKLRIGWL